MVEFYSTHPELRDELAAEAGLERVRTLMSVPVWQIEEEESLPLPSACAHGPAASNKACAPAMMAGARKSRLPLSWSLRSRPALLIARGRIAEEWPRRVAPLSGRSGFLRLSLPFSPPS